MTQRFAVLSVLVLALAVLSGCARDRAPVERGADAQATRAPAAVVPGAAVGGNVGARALVTTIDVTVVAPSGGPTPVDEAVAKLRGMTLESGGFVAEQSVSGAEGEKTARVELRVPAERLGAFRASLGGSFEIVRHDEKVEDVTEQRADTAARLHNARVQEKRIVELLGQRASSIGEVIEAEKELARVRETIERLEAQERLLEGKITMATIRVTVTMPEAKAWQTPGASLARSARAGLRGAAALAVYSGMALATVLPTVLPLALLGVLVALFVRRRRQAAASL